MTNKSFRTKLLSDLTLFELSDVSTVNFYTKHMDYFIDNFIFFRDVDLVAQFFIANEIFSSHFDLGRFIQCIDNFNKKHPCDLESDTLSSYSKLSGNSPDSHSNAHSNAYGGVFGEYDGVYVDNPICSDNSSSTSNNSIYTVTTGAITNTVSDLAYAEYSRVILFYYKKQIPSKLFNRTMNILLQHIKKTSHSNSTSNSTSNNNNNNNSTSNTNSTSNNNIVYNTSLVDLLAKIILMKYKKVNINLFISDKPINIKITAAMVEISKCSEESSKEVLIKEIGKKSGLFMERYIRIGIERGWITETSNTDCITDCFTDGISNNITAGISISISSGISNINTEITDIFECDSSYVELFDILHFSQTTSVPVYYITCINRYTQYYMRLLSRSNGSSGTISTLSTTSAFDSPPSGTSGSMVPHGILSVYTVDILLSLAFSNPNNSYLLKSIFRILRSTNLRNNPKVLQYMREHRKEEILCRPIREQLHGFLSKIIQPKTERENTEKEIEEDFDLFVYGKIIEKIPVSGVFEHNNEEST